MNIAIFIISLAIIVLLHELGHFIAGKYFKVKVEEFGIGFPPRILKLKHKETIYSINSIPLGGFVKFSVKKIQMILKALKVNQHINDSLLLQLDL